MGDFNYSGKLKKSVLIVDDEEINRMILGNILEETYEIFYAENGAQALELLTEGKVRFSLILMDLLMPVMDGFTLLGKIRQDEIMMNIPVIVMTSEKPAEVQSIKLGADDFIAKPYDMPEVILARCERIIGLYETRSVKKSAEKDPLTSLYTREFFKEYVRQIDGNETVSDMDAIVLNIEHFHTVNELFGRHVGDEVLRKIADMLDPIFGSGIWIGCRPNADYYYVYVEHRESHEDVFLGLQEELKQFSQIPRIRIRAGIYPKADKRSTVEERFDHAKLACDRIRGDYTKNVSFYSKELSDVDLYHERLINDMDAAMENKDLIVYYQPKYDVTSEQPRLRSAEALIRWKHPELGMISPGDFIPLFESNGLIQKLDHYVWGEAASQIRKWREAYGKTVPVSVNVSRVDIYDAGLEKRLLDLVEENGLTPEELMPEITESAYADDAKGLTEAVEKLRKRGFKIEMDDFGSGYSSLNMLTTIPIDVLKMDMKFIRNMNRDEKSRKMGCSIIQGYYFSKPVPPKEFEGLIQKELEK